MASSVALTLIAALFEATATPTPAAFAAPKPACPASRPDVVSATITARLCGGKILVAGDESPTTEVYALPNGTLQASTALSPVRVQQADGTWAPINLTLLANADGTASPAMSAYPISMAKADPTPGEHQLVTLGLGADAVGIGWTGALPAPTLSENTATYPDVKPGIDLVVTATASGVEQDVVIKNRAALAQVKNLVLPVTSTSAAAYSASGGGAVIKDKHGIAFARVPGMQMWDSALDPQTRQPVKRGMKATFGALSAKKGRSPGVNMTLAPDSSWLNDPARVFPITLDPTLSKEATTFDTYVKQGSSTDYSADNDLQFGTTLGDVTRSFLSWDMTQLEHATISSATAYFYGFYSASCTAAQWDVYFDAAGATASTTWANQPAGTKLESPSSTQTKGFSSSCDDGWISVDAKNFFADAAATGGSRGYMQLRAHDESSTSIGFKQVRSRNASDPSQVPYAVVNYTTTPIIGTRSTTPSTSCVTGAGRPYINTTTPTLKTVVTQGNGATATVNFEWWNVGGAKIGGASPTGVASGSTASATVPAGAFTQGGNYMWHVNAVSGGSTSPWSSYCEFTIDTIAPTTAPTVSSTAYPSGQWAGVAGQAGAFGFGASGVADVNSYVYGLDSTPSTSVAAASLGGVATATITPTSSGAHILYVQSVDRAGNRSPVASYTFYVGGAAVTSPAVGATVPGTTLLAGQAPTTTTGVTYQWRRSDTDTWVTVPKSDVTYAAGGAAVTGWPIAPSGGVYPNLNWNVKQTLANANTPANLKSRWSFSDGSGTKATDMTGAYPATLTGGVTWAQDASHGMTAAFNGTTGYFATATPVITTNASYTVSAWVKLTDNTSQHTVFSQNGTDRSPFYLQYDDSTNKWRLYLSSADVSTPTWYNAASTTYTPQLNVWAHLVGVYDATAHTIKLYINGQAQGSATGVSTWNSTGVTWIGRSASTYFKGNISDAQIYSRALTAAEVTNLYGTGTVTGNAAALGGPVQVQAIFAGTGGSTAAPVGFSYDPTNADAGVATVGPGNVNLATGNFTVSASDAGDGGSLGFTRVYSTRQYNTVDPLFGPGWVAGVRVPSAEYTRLTQAGTIVQVGQPDGSSMGFGQLTSNASGATYKPQAGVDPGFALTYTVNAIASPATPANSYTLTDPSGDRTIFTQVTGAGAGQYSPTASTEAQSTSGSSTSWQKVGADIQPTTVLAPVPAGVSCTTLVRGCRAMSFTYATVTTATGTTSATWGDYNGRIKSVSVTAWNPATSAMATVVVSQYAYDVNGRLTAQWDPRLDNGATHAWMTYAYDANGILSSMTPIGQQPWTFAYTTVPQDNGLGRLASVSRSALSAGTAVESVVYNVPVTGTGAPYDLSTTQTARWGQIAAPLSGTAVFGPDFVPSGGNQVTGVMPTSFAGANIVYMDAGGRSVDNADGNGNISVTWYDVYGNTVASLSAGNRAAALAASTTDTAAQEAALANRESSLATFTPDGVNQVDSFGPEHDVQLASGAVVRGRTHDHLVYDEGATGGPYGLPTTDTLTTRWYDQSGASNDSDSHVTKHTYDWASGRELTTTVDPTGTNLTTTYTYDSGTGQPASVTQPAGFGTTNTPSTMRTIYYRAGTGSGFTDCDSHPEWDGLTCRTQVGGQAATGPEVPVKLYTYTMFDQPNTIVEKTDITGSGGTVERTTQYGYEPVTNRVSTVAVTTSAALGGTTVTTKVIYDTVTGLPTQTQQLDASNNVLSHIDVAYDTLGRIISYRDADGNVSLTSYDIASRSSVESDGQASRTYTYNGGTERRGLPSQVVDQLGGTFTATFNADGQPTAQSWPNSISVAMTYNEEGSATGITYTQAGSVLYAQSVVEASNGLTGSSNSTMSQQNYAYDGAGRITQVSDTVSGCSTRVYAYNTATDRTGLTTYDPNSDGTCQTTTPSDTPTLWTYDTADRVNTSGYAYDALGRTTTIPNSDTDTPDSGPVTESYYANDMIAGIIQGDRSDTYTLDPVGNRIRSWTDTVTGGTTLTKINHYNDASDTPAWTDEGDTTFSRPVSSLVGVASIYESSVGNVWQIANLHGDFVAGVDGAGAGLAYTSEYTEFGQPRNADDVGTRRYGWLGEDGRASDAPGGMTLMGARTYNPDTGRFSSVDSVYGGNANAYDYCSGDSIDCSDPSGDKGTCARTHESGSIETSWAYHSHWYGDNWWTSVDETVSFHLKCKLGNKDTVYLLDNLDEYREILGVVIGGVLATVICGGGFGNAWAFVCGIVGGIVGVIVAHKAGNWSLWYSASCGGGNGINYQMDIKAFHDHTWGRTSWHYHFNYSFTVFTIRNFQKRCNVYSD